MPIAPLTTTSINLPALVREGRAREGLASRESLEGLEGRERNESRARAPRAGDEQRSDAKSVRRVAQPDDSAQAGAVLVAAAHEQQFIEALAPQRAMPPNSSAPFEKLSTTPSSTMPLSATQSHALRSYLQTQNINVGNARAGSELIVGIDTFV